MSRAVHFYRGLGFEIVHGGEEVEFTSFLAGKSCLRRESRKRLVMLGPEANQMTTSKTIAGLIGPTLVAIAASMLLNIGSFLRWRNRFPATPRSSSCLASSCSSLGLPLCAFTIAGRTDGRCSAMMEYRDIEYTVVQGIRRNLWKWSASVANVVITGQSYSKSEAVVEAEKAIDRALAPKKVRLVPLPRRWD